MKANKLPHETRCSEELENATARRLLANSFEAIELEYLQQNQQFQKAVAEMHTFDAFEKTTSFGHYLLIERDERGKPSNIVIQNFRSCNHFE